MLCYADVHICLQIFVANLVHILAVFLFLRMNLQFFFANFEIFVVHFSKFLSFLKKFSKILIRRLDGRKNTRIISLSYHRTFHEFNAYLLHISGFLARIFDGLYKL